MCGIFGILDIKTDVSELRTQALDYTKLLRHRGPDWSGIWNNDNTILCHERLAIVDVDTGAQPLISQDNNKINWSVDKFQQQKSLDGCSRPCHHHLRNLAGFRIAVTLYWRVVSTASTL